MAGRSVEFWPSLERKFSGIGCTLEAKTTVSNSGLPRSVKSQGKMKIFQGQGKVREFCKKSGKILVLVKVSEKSRNFVFRLPQGFLKIMKTFSFGKLC